jgi:hypothetical protein
VETASPEPGEAASPEPGESEAPEASGARGAALRNAGQAAARVSKVALGKVGPALAGASRGAAAAVSGAGARARGAMAGIIARIQQKRAERAGARKTAGPRRMTAPPPAGALRSEGRRLVREGGEQGEIDEAAPRPRVNKRAAVLGSFLGLAAVLAVFGAARFLGLRGASGEGAAAPPALPAADSASAAPGAAEAPAPAPGGALAANVPLFGATPLSTTEPVPPSSPPSPSAAGDEPGGALDPGAADPMAAAAPGAGQADEEPSLGDDGKAWGQGNVRNPTVLKLKVDGAIERLNGAAGPMGFTVSLPDRRALSSGTGLARKDKRIASIRVVNTPQGAEVSLQFKDGVPAYLAKANGNRLEIALGNDAPPKKVAAKQKKPAKSAKPAKKGKGEPAKKKGKKP